jgi:hypothetical protein
MNEPLSLESLEKLISRVEAAKPPKRTEFILTPSVWKDELRSHPDRFRMDNGELLWLGVKVGTIGSKRKQDEFWRMVDKFVMYGIIF